MPEAAAKEAGITGGLFVAGVVAGGPAEKAGLQTGDVITTVDGKQATSNIQLQEVTLTKNPGETVELGYLRNGKAEKATVTLGRAAVTRRGPTGPDGSSRARGPAPAGRTGPPRRRSGGR